MPTGRPTNAEFPTAASTPPVSIMNPEPGQPAASRAPAAAANTPAPSPRPAAAPAAAVAAKKPPPKPRTAAAPVQIAPAAAPAPAASND
jgi:hypothetical protein